MGDGVVCGSQFFAHVLSGPTEAVRRACVHEGFLSGRCHAVLKPIHPRHQIDVQRSQTDIEHRYPIMEFGHSVLEHGHPSVGRDREVPDCGRIGSLPLIWFIVSSWSGIGAARRTPCRPLAGCVNL
jgi:hypothetical protein